MTGVEQMVGALSGGNQQKVVLAKWLASKPRLLILDEPTRGIDIGAKVEVHRIISELAASGLGIILISSDLPEVLAMSDRILVLHEGRVTAEIARGRGDRGAGHVRRDRQPARADAGGRAMTDAGATADPRRSRATAARGSASIARQRELSLVAIMIVLGALVSIAAPQFLTVDNISQVAVLASIVAVAAVGEALVVITRNVDLSVEAMMGLVAYCVAVSLENHMFGAAGAILFGIGIGLVLGMINGFIVARPAGPGDRRDARHAEHLPRHRLPHRGQPPGAQGRACRRASPTPPTTTSSASRSSSSSPIVVVVIGSVLLRWTTFGRQFYAVGSNPEAAAILGIPSRLVVFVAFALCGLLAGVAGVMYVIEFGTINGTSAGGYTLQVDRRGRRRRGRHLRWHGDPRRSGARARSSSGSSPTPSSSSACRSSGCRRSTAWSSWSRSAPTPSSCDGSSAPPR